MVNTGKPSRGCEPCKKRHVKCDLTLPYCKKCSDSGRVCPGVPDENDLRFVKQRDPFKPRKKKRAAPKKSPILANGPKPSASSDGKASPQCDSGIDLDSLQIVLSRPQSRERDKANNQQVGSGPSFALSPSWENVAVAFFFDNFMSGESKWVNPVVRTLQRAWQAPSFKRNSATDNSTAAIALAAMSHYPEMGHLRTAAMKHYQKALVLTQAALSNSKESKSEDTLLSVILMGMYERIATSDETSKLNLLQHSMGAIALVYHIGPPTASNSASSQLFSVVRFSLILETAAEGTAMDEKEIEQFWFATPLDPQDHSSHLYYLGSSVPNLRSRARMLFKPAIGTPDKDEVSDLLADARAVDTKLLHWFQNLPEEWQYSSVQHIPQTPVDIQSSPFWPGPQYIYNDLFQASILSNYRILRILTQSVIAQCLSALDARQTTVEVPSPSFLYGATVQTARSLVDDIAASVPAQFSMNMVTFQHLPIGTPQGRAKEALGAFYLVRPLYIASCVEGIDELQREWLRGRLKFIAEEFGLMQALSLSRSKVVFPMSWKTDSDPEHCEILHFHP